MIELLATAKRQPDKRSSGFFALHYFNSTRWFSGPTDLLRWYGSGGINDSLQELGCGALLEGCKPLDKQERRHASFCMICSNHQQDLNDMGVCSCLLPIVHEASPVYRWTAEKEDR